MFDWRVTDAGPRLLMGVGVAALSVAFTGSIPAVVDVTVADASELAAALSTVVGGEVIGLEPGNYGHLNISNTYPSTVTLISKTLHAAQFDQITMNGTTNITLDGFNLPYVWQSGDNDYDKMFQILNATSCDVQNCLFTGTDSSTGYGFAEGLFLRWSDACTVKNNKFVNFTRQFHAEQCAALTVSGNEHTGMRGDGITLVDCTGGTVISGNNIHTFRCSDTDGYHRDAIEYWAGADTPLLDDLHIINNTIDIMEGPWSQSIFGRNAINAVYSGNYIRNYHTHGITPGAPTTNITVSGNTLVKYANAALAQNQASLANGTSTPKINIVGSVGTCTDNTTPSAITIPAGWTASGNIVA